MIATALNSSKIFASYQNQSITFVLQDQYVVNSQYLLLLLSLSSRSLKKTFSPTLLLYHSKDKVRLIRWQYFGCLNVHNHCVWPPSIFWSPVLGNNCFNPLLNFFHLHTMCNSGLTGVWRLWSLKLLLAWSKEIFHLST